MALKEKLSIIIAGPTGVGKTDFSILLGKKIHAEILNIDMGQFYSKLKIGTAKPDWQNEQIKHHLFDIVNNPEDYTTFEYTKDALKTSDEILNDDKIPMFVGGSGFYINSLFFPQKEKTTSLKIKNLNKNNFDLWNELFEIDPIRAKQIDKNDNYRILRALEIWQTTGIIPSKYEPHYEPLSNFVLIVLIRNRDELYKMINDRVIKMVDSGWIDEVKNLSQNWKIFLKRKKIIGYDDILDYLNDQCDKNELIETIQKKVRNYAKRQLTFFKYLTKKIVKCELQNKENIYTKKIIWANLSQVNPNNLIQHISNYLDELKFS